MVKITCEDIIVTPLIGMVIYIGLFGEAAPGYEIVGSLISLFGGILLGMYIMSKIKSCRRNVECEGSKDF